MGNSVSWLLVILGVICVIAELALGVMTGFDLALIGASLIAGGIVGLVFGSSNIGLLSTAILALLYFALFRNWLKSKQGTSRPTWMPSSGALELSPSELRRAIVAL